MTACILLYTDKIGVRGQFKGPLEKCYGFAIGTEPRDWAIYRATLQGRDFHNATDERYLIAHDDHYWHHRRFGRAAPLVDQESGGWAFWALEPGPDDFYYRKVAEIEKPDETEDFSRAFHDIAGQHGYTVFVPDQSMIGGYFRNKSGETLQAYPAWMRPSGRIREDTA